MRHLQNPTLIAASDDEGPVEAEADALDGACGVGEGAFADPVDSVVEGDEGVGAADCEVAAAGGEGEGDAGGGVRVEAVEG